MIDGTTLPADVCIVGGGPAGLTLAAGLLQSGMNVVLLESGCPAPDLEAQELNIGETAGDSYHELHRVRFRGIGGTAGIWNTSVHGAAGGKYLPLDEIDLEPRDWIPWSGWPFGRGVLEPFYRDAYVACGLGAPAPTTCGDEIHPCLNLHGSDLRNGVYHLGSAARFDSEIPALLRESQAVTIVTGATMTGLHRTGTGGPVRAAEWLTLGGRRGTVTAGRFVLAAGGIENARLLLLDRAKARRDVTTSDWLGRGFMEHPVDTSLELISDAPELATAPGFYGPHQSVPAATIMGRIGLSRELMRTLKVPNASIRFGGTDDIAVLEAVAARAAARRLVPFLSARRLIHHAVRRAALAYRFARGRRYQVAIDLEQVPHPDNRVVLSDRPDRLGQPRAVLHWSWRKEDEANRMRIRAAIVRELERAHLGQVRLRPGRPLDPNAHHHAGTTRMHRDPGQGVVDENLQVHGEENLFVTGSSVFPTAGFANPTLTVVALSLRLAKYLAS